MLDFEKRVEFVETHRVHELEDLDDNLDREDALQVLAPWARDFVRCGGGYQAFESLKEARAWKELC
jgi:hypothetical protein